MKGLNLITKKLTGKFAGKLAAKTVLKKLALASCTNVFTSVLIWIIEFFLHPFMKKWRDDLLTLIGWNKKKEEPKETAIIKKES